MPSDLPERILEILRNSVIVNKDISDEEKIKYYKYYRSDTIKSRIYFPKSYEDATKDMIAKGIEGNT